jgi:hypothetical protein
LGDRSAALRVLRQSIEGGFFPYPYMARDFLLDNLRSEPEFHRLMALAKDRHDSFRR